MAVTHVRAHCARCFHFRRVSACLSFPGTCGGCSTDAELIALGVGHHLGVVVEALLLEHPQPCGSLHDQLLGSGVHPLLSLEQSHVIWNRVMEPSSTTARGSNDGNECQVVSGSLASICRAAYQ